MIETLILGIIVGIAGAIGAAYAIHKFLNKKLLVKKFDSGYEILACDLGYDDNSHGYIGIKKDGKIIAGIKYDEKGITDIVYDI